MSKKIRWSSIAAALLLVFGFSATGGILSANRTSATAEEPPATVVKDGYSRDEAVSAEGNKGVSYEADKFGNQGVTFTADEEHKSYGGRIGGQFFGNAAIEFAFPHDITDGSVAAKSEFVFTISDLEGNAVFDVVYFTDGGWTNIYVRYGEEIRAYTEDSSVNWNHQVQFYRIPSGEQQMMSPYLGVSYTEENKTRAGTLFLEWDDDGVLSVGGQTRYRNRDEILAKFDGSEKPDNITDGTVVTETGTPLAPWGLPKLPALRDGYTISFAYNGQAVMPVTFISVNGVSLTEETLSASYDFETRINDAKHSGKEVYVKEGADTKIGGYTAYYTAELAEDWGFLYAVKKQDFDAEFPEVTVEIPGKYSVEIKPDLTTEGLPEDYAEGAADKVSEIDVFVEEEWFLSFDTAGGKEIPSISYTEHLRDALYVPDAEKTFWRFDGWETPDGTPWTDEMLETLSGDVTLTANYSDVTPADIMLADGIESLSSRLLGYSEKISASDVVVTDAANPDSAKLLSVEVKEPNGSFTPFETGENTAVLLNKTGIWAVRYTGTDSLNGNVSLTRYIAVFERMSPSVTISSARVESGVTDVEVALAEALALDMRGNPLEVNVTVTDENGNVCASGVTSFVPDSAGVYTVTYTAEDSEGLIGRASYEITVSDDTQAPVLVVDMTNIRVQRGTDVVIPAVVVTDNVDKDLTAEITVTYGTENVEFDSAASSFKADKAGTYIVHFKVTDKAGNVSETTRTVTVLPDAEGEEKGCGSSLAFIAAAPVLLAAAALLKKRDEKNDK